MEDVPSVEEAIDRAKKLQADSEAQAALDLLEPLHRAGPVAKLLDATASALYDLGRMAEARARRYQAIALHRDAGDKAGESGTLFLLGAMDAREGKIGDARKNLERCLTLRREINDRAGTARALQKLGSMDLDEFRESDARSRLEEALRIKRELGEEGTKGTTFLTFQIGRLDLREGKHSDARPKFERWLEDRRAARDRVGEASTLRILGTIDYVEDRPHDALEKLNLSMDIWQVLGDQAQVATTLNSVASVAISIGDLSQACAVLAKAYDLVRNSGDESAEMEVVENIGLLAWKRGLKDVGMTLLAMCQHRHDESSERRKLTRGFGEVSRASGLSEPEARALLLRAAELFRNQHGKMLVEQALKGQC